jgi:radical SAM superfamily enzyme YgiQ (UPF0313 family)
MKAQSLSLSVIAALTPPGHEVTTVMEELEDVPFDRNWDLVGISTLTAAAPHAYELARRFRSRGIRVVIGGVHPSVLPEEAVMHADAVVIGEAEGVWPKIVADAERNQLERCYRNWQPDISSSPVPIRNSRGVLDRLIPNLLPVMCSRGCPNDCEFCCVQKVMGRKPRFVDLERVISDIRNSGMKKLVFVDDNIAGNRTYARNLFTELRKLKVQWIAQASVRLILDEELFDLAVKSGARGLLVGVETVEPDAFKRLKKSPTSIEDYEKAIRRCHDAGVFFHATLIFGLDGQGDKVFDHTLEFLMRNKVHTVQSNILTPYPGTPLYDRLRNEGRIIHTNWTYYDQTVPVYKPLFMKPEELMEKFVDFREKFFSWASILKRGFSQHKNNKFVYWAMNIGFRAMTEATKQHGKNYFEWLASQKPDELQNFAERNYLSPPAL